MDILILRGEKLFNNNTLIMINIASKDIKKK
jgi:hypothetical protein